MKPKPHRQVTFVKLQTGYFIVREYDTSGDCEAHYTEHADRSFRRMTELKNEGFKLVYERTGRHYVYELC